MVEHLDHGRDEVERLAHTDAVTELPNRQASRQATERVLKTLSGRASDALLFNDLDLFKTVDDTFGHDAGDALLRLVRERLEEGPRFAFPPEPPPSERPILAGEPTVPRRR